MKGRIAEGNVFDAAARVVVYLFKAQHRIDENTFDVLRKLLLAHPEVSPAEFKAILREQWAILAVDERAAIEALPQLLPANAKERQAISDLLQANCRSSWQAQCRWAAPAERGLASAGGWHESTLGTATQRRDCCRMRRAIGDDEQPLRTLGRGRPPVDRRASSQRRLIDLVTKIQRAISIRVGIYDASFIEKPPA